MRKKAIVFLVFISVIILFIFLSVFTLEGELIKSIEMDSNYRVRSIVVAEEEIFLSTGINSYGIMKIDDDNIRQVDRFLHGVLAMAGDNIVFINRSVLEVKWYHRIGLDSPRKTLTQPGLQGVWYFDGQQVNKRYNFPGRYIVYDFLFQENKDMYYVLTGNRVDRFNKNWEYVDTLTVSKRQLSLYRSISIDSFDRVFIANSNQLYNISKE